MFAIPAVWDRWTKENGRGIISLGALTWKPSWGGGEIHNRNPCSCRTGTSKVWLDILSPAKEIEALLVPDLGSWRRTSVGVRGKLGFPLD